MQPTPSEMEKTLIDAELFLTKNQTYFPDHLFLYFQNVIDQDKKSVNMIKEWMVKKKI